MAITLNKLAVRCKKIAVDNGRISPDSSPRPLLYDISRDWRKLLNATPFLEPTGKWSEREAAAGEVILSAVTYLEHIKCKDIEQLIRDVIDRRAGQSAQ